MSLPLNLTIKLRNDVQTWQAEKKALLQSTLWQNGWSCFHLKSCYLKEQHDNESWRLLGLNKTHYGPNKLVFPLGLL